MLLAFASCERPGLSDKFIYGSWQIIGYESANEESASATEEIAESQVYHFTSSGKCLQENKFLNSHDTNFYILNPANKTLNFINEENELGAFYKVNVVSNSEMEWIIDLGDEAGSAKIELERI